MTSPPKFPRRTRGELGFVIFLVALGLLALVSWLLDPHHRDDGGSRVWPDPKSSHP
ncbi:MAG TPA: hypothetical protein VHD32_16020 [Candidatus Didemnitutus sp.]|nr:hypothetical protein [Candidatus Didemnitutus sp.]